MLAAVTVVLVVQEVPAGQVAVVVLLAVLVILQQPFLLKVTTEAPAPAAPAATAVVVVQLQRVTSATAVLEHYQI